MHLKSILPLFLLVSLISACKKDEDKPQEIVYPNYSQLKVGNYWVYQRFDVDTEGVVTPTSTYDSCYIAKDTVIFGKTYFKMVRPRFPYGDSNYVYVRDSLHYLVNHKGIILFSSEDSATIFDEEYVLISSDTAFRMTKNMETDETVLATPAGLFSAMNFVVTYYKYPGIAFGVGDYPRHMNTYYAKDIGIVTETLQIFAGNPNHIERRLVRYHLN